MCRRTITDENFHVYFAAHIRKEMWDARKAGATTPEYIEMYAEKIGETSQNVDAIYKNRIKPTSRVLADMGLKPKYESYLVPYNKLKSMGFEPPDDFEITRTRYIRVRDA